MKEKNSKKVIIINEIASDTIEQAIFILKNSGKEVKPISQNSYVLAEAQNIIKSYIDKIENSPKGIYRKKKIISTKLKSALILGSTLLFGMGICYVMVCVFENILKTL